jgi:hypothetical protein
MIGNVTSVDQWYEKRIFRLFINDVRGILSQEFRIC